MSGRYSNAAVTFATYTDKAERRSTVFVGRERLVKVGGKDRGKSKSLLNEAPPNSLFKRRYQHKY